MNISLIKQDILHSKIKYAHSKEQGFTIVELLIVIVVIAILASISIVSYTGVQERANEVAIASDLSNFADMMELYSANKSVYPTADDTALAEALAGYRVNQPQYSQGYSYNGNRYNFVYCVSTNQASWGVLVWSVRSNQAYRVGSGQVPIKTSQGPIGSATACQHVLGSSVPYSSNWLYTTVIPAPSWRSYMISG